MSIKLNRAAKISPLSRYPRTWSALIDRIPRDVRAALTAKQIAVMAEQLRAQYEDGHSAGWRDAQ
jgi:hypothetical protein